MPGERIIDGPALARALDAFVREDGHGISWNEVPAILHEAVHGPAYGAGFLNDLSTPPHPCPSCGFLQGHGHGIYCEHASGELE